MLRPAPGVDVPRLHARRDGQPGGEHPPHHAGELGAGRPARHPGHRLALLHPLADGGQRLERPVRRDADDALGGVAPHIAGDAGVGGGAPPGEQAAQIVPPHGLHHAVAVHPGGEAGPQGQHHRRVGNGRAQVALGQDGVHHPAKGQLHQNGRLRIAEHGNLPPLQRPAGRPGGVVGAVVSHHIEIQQLLWVILPVQTLQQFPDDLLVLVSRFNRPG